MRSRFAGLMVGAVACALLGVAVMSSASEQDKKDGDPKRPDISAKCADADRLGSALSLAAYGKKNKAPEALLLAAVMIAESPIPDVSTEGPVKVKDGSGKPMDRVKVAEGLIADALKMDGADELKSLTKKAKQAVAAKPRSPVGGFQSFQGYFNDISNTGDSFIVQCVGGQNTTAQVTCFPIDNYVDLDLEIYNDQTGALVTADRSPAMNAICTWYAPATGAYRIRVVNYPHTRGILSRCNYSLSVY
jgi:hypothetical protein